MKNSNIKVLTRHAGIKSSFLLTNPSTVESKCFQERFEGTDFPDARPFRSVGGVFMILSGATFILV